MAKPELGVKRLCPETGKKFYDLNKDPVVSPYTGQDYPRSYFEADTPELKTDAPEPDEAEPEAAETEEDDEAAVELDADAGPVAAGDDGDDDGEDDAGDDLPDGFSESGDDDLSADNDDDDDVATFIEDDDDTALQGEGIIAEGEESDD